MSKSLFNTGDKVTFKRRNGLHDHGVVVKTVDGGRGNFVQVTDSQSQPYKCRESELTHSKK